MPLYVAGLPIFSKAYYSTRPFEESTLDIPLGSGPYKVGKFEANRYIEFERVKDWWAADLPVNRGSYNFDIVRYEFYRDRDVAFEGFTGKNYLFREEFTARVWATRYDFPAVKDGRVKRETLPDERRPARRAGSSIPAATVQGSARARSADRRVRFRMDQQDDHVRRLCAHQFAVPEFGHDGERAAFAGRAEAAGAVRGQVPDEVFGEPFVPPVSDGSGQDRALLRKAAQLLNDAGLTSRTASGCCRTASLQVEFLLDEPSFQPHHAPYIENLGMLGIEASVRLVDAVQYRARVEEFDFDMTIERMRMSATPGDSMRPYFSSQAAANKGSHNLAGIANPAIDALIEKSDRRRQSYRPDDCLPRSSTGCSAPGATGCRNGMRTRTRLAYWDVFSHPEKPPRYRPRRRVRRKTGGMTP